MQNLEGVCVCKVAEGLENLLCHAAFMIKADGARTRARTRTHARTRIIPWAFGSEALAGSDELRHCLGWLQVSNTFAPLFQML